MMVNILGVSAFSHDSAAALVRDGAIIGAAQEERFTRRKFDARFPARSVQFCLAEAGLRLEDVDYVVFDDKPLVTSRAFVPMGLRSLITCLPEGMPERQRAWLTNRRHLKSVLREELQALSKAGGVGDGKPAMPPLLFNEHHRSHAASAFFASPYPRAAVLCVDGAGEGVSTSAWLGEGNRLQSLWEIRFPHSLGLLYSAFTAYCGFKANSGEYKLMGLAPYGEPRYAGRIRETLIDIRDDGTFRLNLAYFGGATGIMMINRRFADLFGGAPRKPESPLEQRHMDLARSIQVVTEQVLLRLARALHTGTAETHLCLAGGVALNCVANGRLLREGPFADLWIPPAAGDAGGALGAALSTWYEFLGNERRLASGRDLMRGGYLGPAFDDDAAEAALKDVGAIWRRLSDDDLFPRLAKVLDEGAVVGWMQGRMEFGPRALGARSILGDARSPKMQSVMNLKIKYRESFRPFAPAVLAERVGDYFAHQGCSPYMLLTVPVHPRIRIPMTAEQQALSGLDRLTARCSEIPAVTHVDYSARIQTVHQDTNPRFWRLLKAFEQRTGCGVLINTSFNVRGEPIVCSPLDAYRCFMRTEMEYLVIGNCLLAKADQPPHADDGRWRNEFELD